jgi:hypothetical protein
MPDRAVLEHAGDFRLEEPGLVNVTEWRNPVAMTSQTILYGGVARKTG